MPWQVKTKVEQQGEEEKILTPDGVDILVGSSENQILLFAYAFNNWTQKTKNAVGDWQLKTKVEA